MPLAFPIIKRPTRRPVLTPGSYPVRQFTAVNGANTTVIRGDRATEATLELEYSFLPDSEAAEVLQLWHDSLGGFRSVDLPANAYEGLDSSLTAQIPSYLTWYMRNEPSIESTDVPGRSRMRLEFVGRLDA